MKSSGRLSCLSVIEMFDRGLYRIIYIYMDRQRRIITCNTSYLLATWQCSVDRVLRSPPPQLDQTCTVETRRLGPEICDTMCSVSAFCPTVHCGESEVGTSGDRGLASVTGLAVIHFK